jgi:glycosyltransferase involved in cell wall biosynthesis
MSPRIAFVFRRSAVFFSIENIFRNIIRQIGNHPFPEGYAWVAAEKVVPREGLAPSGILANIRFVRKLRADIFHVTGDIHYITLFLPSKRSILTVHDCVFMYNNKGIKRWILQLLMLKWPVRHCQRITCVSEQTKKDILRFTGCPENKVVVIPNPVNQRISRTHRDFETDRPVLLFVGTTPNKNLDRVMDALDGIPCMLDIVGRLDPVMEQRLTERRIAYRNSFDLTEEQVFDKYNGADIILFPSTYEGFGMPIVEGQKAGRPVITSRLSPMQEVAGDAACLVDPYDAGSIREGILKVIRDPAYRQQLVTAGLENSRRFDLETVTRQYEELYKNIIERFGINT